MCGIVGVVGRLGAWSLVLEGLRHLEYRGYDSAGFATVQQGALQRYRAVGKRAVLESLLQETSHIHEAAIGIGHTRWASHGPATERNAHPHAGHRVAVVHNGIIENDRALREQLTAEGVVFQSDTDTEVIPWLVESILAQGMGIEQAWAQAIAGLKGAYAVAMVDSHDPDHLYVARKGSPMALATMADGGVMVSSDPMAMAPWVRSVVILEDGDRGIVSASGWRLWDEHGLPVERPERTLPKQGDAQDRGIYDHYMLKEIHEQPEVLGRLFAKQAVSEGMKTDPMQPDSMDWLGMKAVQIFGCGSSYFAGQLGARWLERYAQLPAQSCLASEYRGHRPILPEGGLALAMSQSGETADTLTALRCFIGQGFRLSAMVNSPFSTMERLVDHCWHIEAGKEVSVAATKSFTAQMLMLALIALHAGHRRGVLDRAGYDEAMEDLASLPSRVAEVLAMMPQWDSWAKESASFSSHIMIARGDLMPLASEGALKMKELAYIHAEAIPGGECKHGPLALIDESMPVTILLPSGPGLAAGLSTAEEIVARSRRVMIVTDHEGASHCRHLGVPMVLLPMAPPLLQPFLYAIPMQYLAYRTAVFKGLEIDQPRHLAKSVTVE